MCISFNSPTGRLIAGLNDGLLQSWLCTPYVTSHKSIPVGFVDAHTRLTKARNDISIIESKLSSIDPSVRDADARAARIKNEIARLQQQSTKCAFSIRFANYFLVDECNKELASIETDAMKEAMKNIVDLEEQLQFAQGEIVNCNRIIDHVTECCSTNGYFSSLQSGVYFDQWLFDSGLGHLVGTLKDIDGDSLINMSIVDLVEGGLSYIDACDIHIRACLTAHMQQVGTLPNVFNWDATHVSTWLESQGDSCSSLKNLGWTGPSLIALTPKRIESASNKTIKGESARALKEAIVSLIKDDNSLSKWMRKWTGALPIAEYGEV